MANVQLMHTLCARSCLYVSQRLHCRRCVLQVMIIGDFKGTKVQDVKKLIQDQLVSRVRSV